MEKNHDIADNDGLLRDKMKKMLAEGRSREQCLLEVVKLKCLSPSHELPSEAEAQIMLKEPVVHQFAFFEFSRMCTELGF